MLRQSVLGAVLVGVLALFVQGRSTPNATPAPADAAEQEPGGSSARKAQEKKEDKPPEPHALRLLEQFFGVSAGAKLPPGYSLDTLVATLPDPLASRLDWLFDQQLDALRRAHETACFVATSYWMPWHEKDADATKEPGVYLFRSEGRKLRLLWLVGEVPTSGVHRLAFQEALAQRELAYKALGPDAPPRLDVIGPEFSGSAQSLRDELDRWLAHDSARNAQVVTGCATSASNQQVLKTDRIEFFATVHSDETLLACLRDIVVARFGIRPHQVAVLRESSTQYGAAMAKKEKQEQKQRNEAEPKSDAGFLMLPFPMNISSLRESLKAKKSDDAKKDETKKETGAVALDLSEKARELPKPMSPLSAAASEQLLAELARTIEDHNIRLVVLFATDVRDKLFLGREIANRLPDLQLLTTESNLLYLRSELAEGQRGMLVLSTYPLFDSPTDWRPQALVLPEQRMSFASDGAQGAYNAALLQLDKAGAAVDYAFPFEPEKPKPGSVLETRPPVWLTCVGKTRMLPVAAYEAKLGERPRDSKDPIACAWLASERYPTAMKTTEPEMRPAEGREEPGLGTLLLTAALALAVLVGALGIVWKHRPLDELEHLPDDDPSTPLEEQFQALVRISTVQHDALYRTAHVLVLTSLLLPHTTLLVHLAFHAPTGTNILHAILATITVVGGLYAIGIGARRGLGTAWRHRHRALLFARGHGGWHRARWTIEIGMRVCIAVLAIGWGVAMVLYSFWIASLDDASREAFFHRVTRIEQCVTPLLPLLLIGAAMAAWCSWHMQRARLLTKWLPHEERGKDDRAFDAEDAAPASLRTCLMLAIPDRRGHVIGAVLLLLALWLGLQWQPSLEFLVARAGTSWFDWLFFPGITLMLLTTGWAAYRLGVTWQRFARALGNGSPRQDAACKEIVERGITTSLGLWRPAPQPDLQPEIDALWRELRARTAKAAKDLPAAETTWTSVTAALDAGLLDASSTDPSAQARYEQLDEITRGDLVAVLRAKLPAVELEVDASVDEKSPAERWLDVAHQVLAVELIAWVRWTMSHLRTLALFLLLSVLLTTALLWAYPFHPQTLVRFGFLLVCGAVVAVLTWVVAELSRNRVLASLATSESAPGTWDRTFVRNVLTYSLLPLLTLFASQVPLLGSTLFAWVEPLLKSAVSAG